jgi:hypothetical protein
VARDPYAPLARATYRYDQPDGTEVIEQDDKRIVVHYGKPPRRTHWLVPTSIGVIVTLGLLFVINVVAAWWNGYQTDQKYGYPRIWQTDAVVGHFDSEQNPSHFIFENLRGHVLIIEISGGDPAHSHIYTGPTLLGDNAGTIPVTGEFIKENGRIDLVVHVETQRILYINDGAQFKQQQQ